MKMTNDIRIRPRERDAILRSLAAGVVPRAGLRHIQAGRKDETEALLADLDRVAAGGAAVRFVIGRFGTGKSFFLNLARAAALEKKFVVVQADITPSRRLHSTGGGARALYSELVRSMATRARPDGGALPSVIERWIEAFERDAEPGGENLHAIREKLRSLQDLVGGYDFADVLARYLEGWKNGDEALTDAALRWLAGEYATRTEARAALGVRSIVTDRDLYGYLKLWGAFARLAGYAGLLVNIDEMGNLSHRLGNAASRYANYEVLLQILNDCLQGNVSGVGFLFAGTDAFLDDPRRGLASYGALAGRLAANPYARSGLKDLSGPVIRLPSLSPEELYLLLHNIRNVFASGDPDKTLVPDEALHAFIRKCRETLGATFYQTPRDATKAFVGFLSVLEQNPGADWRALLDGAEMAPDENGGDDKNETPSAPDGPENDEPDELVGFVLK